MTENAPAFSILFRKRRRVKMSQLVNKDNGFYYIYTTFISFCTRQFSFFKYMKYTFFPDWNRLGLVEAPETIE